MGVVGVNGEGVVGAVPLFVVGRGAVAGVAGFDDVGVALCEGGSDGEEEKEED